MGWTTTTAAVAGVRPLFQAEIEPSRLAKMNEAAFPSLGMMKPVVWLKTWPVGPNMPLGGMLTTRGEPTGKGWPAPS